MLLKTKLIIVFISFLFNNLSCTLFDNLKSNMQVIFLDMVEINQNLFSFNTLNTLSLSVPLYLASLNIDKDLNYLFYDKENHRNLRQFTDFSNKYNNLFGAIEFSDILLASSISLSSIYFFSSNQKFKIISYELMLGLTCMGLVKRIVKLIKWDRALRPNNQNFIRDKRYYGGFPSGHLMTMCYLMTIWVKQIGFKSSGPIILATSYMFIDYIIQNRHYLSQLIAGTTLGIIYGLAVNSSINKKLNKNINQEYPVLNPIKLDLINKNKNLSLTLSYYF